MNKQEARQIIIELLADKREREEELAQIDRRLDVKTMRFGQVTKDNCEYLPGKTLRARRYALELELSEMNFKLENMLWQLFDNKTIIEV